MHGAAPEAQQAAPADQPAAPAAPADPPAAAEAQPSVQLRQASLRLAASSDGLVDAVESALRSLESAEQLEREGLREMALAHYDLAAGALSEAGARTPRRAGRAGRAGPGSPAALDGVRRSVSRRSESLRRDLVRQLSHNSGSVKRGRRQSHGPWAFGGGQGPLAAGAAEPEPRPQEFARRPYWRLRLVAGTIAHGAKVTPRLFVPKDTWAQLGFRYTGLATKLECFAKLLFHLALHVRSTDAPADLSSARRANEALRSLKGVLFDIQNRLHSHFPIVPGIDAEAGAAGPPAAPPALSPSRHWRQRVLGAVVAIGRNVASGAKEAAERVAASLPQRATVDDQKHYATLVQQVCEKAQVLDAWWMLCAQRTAALRGAGGAAAAAERAALEEMRVELISIAACLETSVVELILRDLEQLYVRYVRKMRKSFARIYWVTGVKGARAADDADAPDDAPAP